MSLASLFSRSLGALPVVLVELDDAVPESGALGRDHQRYVTYSTARANTICISSMLCQMSREGGVLLREGETV